MRSGRGTPLSGITLIIPFCDSRHGPIQSLVLVIRSEGALQVKWHTIQMKVRVAMSVLDLKFCDFIVLRSRRQKFKYLQQFEKCGSKTESTAVPGHSEA